MTYGQSPLADRVPADWRDKIIHGTLAIGEQRLTGADVLPEEYRSPQGFSVLLQIPEPAEAERIFRILSEKGVVQLALQETYWANRFGMVVDKFGIPWLINCGKSPMAA